MGDIMEFPETVEEFMEEYKMVDKHEIYSNGTEYVPIFRMEQWFEHCRTRSDTAKRCIDVDELIKDLKRQYMFLFGTDEIPNGIQGVIENFPTADVVDKKECSKCVFYPFKQLRESEWIPCSERLPEANGRYLVTRGLNACGAMWNRVYIINYSDLMGLKSEKIWWQGNVGKSDFERIDDVIAWMSLPQPCGERREDEQIH